MTPGARVAAAIEVLDDMAQGLAAEQALTRWARRSRFAGSKDRAAIRDHVFDVLRCRASAAHFGQGQSGRALMIGLLHQQGVSHNSLFTGEGHAPAPLRPEEAAFPAPPEDRTAMWNLPEWLIPLFERALGADAEKTARALQNRAPISLRVNLPLTSAVDVRAELAEEGIETHPNPLCHSALTVSEGARKIRNSNAFQSGKVELQDAASQAVVAALPAGGRVLDYCAGGGGKSLALAMDQTRTVEAHDIDPARMRDLPPRADRAGVKVTLRPSADLEVAGYDTVLCDAPCSGSGSWRRAGEAKWTLTPARLTELTQIQDDILDRAARLVAPNGMLAYATCSVLREENEDRIAAFLERSKGWKLVFSQRFEVDADGDGFFTAHLTHE